MQKLGSALALVVLSLVTLVALPACDSDLNEECSEEGQADSECVDGLVCGKRSATSSDLVCLKMCTSQADCGTDLCSSVGNTSLRACRSPN